jgi:hypothetical protein
MLLQQQQRSNYASRFPIEIMSCPKNVVDFNFHPPLFKKQIPSPETLKIMTALTSRLDLSA